MLGYVGLRFDAYLALACILTSPGSVDPSLCLFLVAGLVSDIERQDQPEGRA